jgi:3-hydroxyisobutyrate dehydrogenase
MSSPNEPLPRSIGFIGLGVMGKPMATNLARSLPRGSQIHAHDAVEAPVDEYCASFPDVAVKCASAREVADKSVS